MTKTSTTTIKYLTMLTVLTLLVSNLAKAQAVPKLKFCQPQLIAGTDGQIGAKYKFSNVLPNIDAYVTIENIVGGAVLRTMDDSTLGYYNAWQPTVGGPGTYGRSYIKWDVKFDSAGSPHQFSTLYASAIDVDGDNVRVREFINVNGQSSYSLPAQIPSMLTLSNTLDTDNINGTDASDSNLNVLGPVMNAPGIDTTSEDVRINFNFTNMSEFKIYTGSEVDSNGTTGGIATDRYHCIYFADISSSYGVLPVTLENFKTVLGNNVVNVNWTTSSDIANDRFEVERSFDEVNFSTAAIVLGAQVTNSMTANYSFTDRNAELSTHSTIYYRLKDVGLNGNVTYSEIKMVRTGNQSLSVLAFPNPYIDKVTVTFESKASGNADIRMINMAGNVIMKMEPLVTTGTNTFLIQNLQSQPPGMYVIKISVNGQSIGSQKILKN